MQVYVVMSESGLCTVGSAPDSKPRVGELEKVTGLKLQVEAVVAMNPNLAASVLGNVQARLESYRQRDGWYACDLDIVKQALYAAHAQEYEEEASWRRADDEHVAEKFLGLGYTCDLTSWLKD
jgi:hypothetical protein